MPVLGIGGLFFRARDPDALTAWYKRHLGVGPGCAAPGAGVADEWTWGVQGGPVAFQPFPADSDYFAADKAWMLNLRVSGLDAMLDDLRAGGVEVITSPDWDQPGVGRFARIHDPEGNAVELWEPAG
ncbi:hypothetical protein SAMN05192583_1295 [Sphingomonas gellani]|uniref:VOC domain-containing protein n=1 Tax=Sphingomonas gellani TaxID=1166340 RepID=A0A1H8BCM3_9SPHN|nr:VOC family protein [Sphingomonas gellani]SEM80199.1 hypothetical protein SAMN05192583_1295 [Sphingomonas gellani]